MSDPMVSQRNTDISLACLIAAAPPRPVFKGSHWSDVKKSWALAAPMIRWKVFGQEDASETNLFCQKRIFFEVLPFTMM